MNPKDQISHLLDRIQPLNLNQLQVYFDLLNSSVFKFLIDKLYFIMLGPSGSGATGGSRRSYRILPANVITRPRHVKDKKGILIREVFYFNN